MEFQIKNKRTLENYKDKALYIEIIRKNLYIAKLPGASRISPNRNNNQNFTKGRSLNRANSLLNEKNNSNKRSVMKQKNLYFGENMFVPKITHSLSKKPSFESQDWKRIRKGLCIRNENNKNTEIRTEINDIKIPLIYSDRNEQNVRKKEKNDTKIKNYCLPDIKKITIQKHKGGVHHIQNISVLIKNPKLVESNQNEEFNNLKNQNLLDGIIGLKCSEKIANKKSNFQANRNTKYLDYQKLSNQKLSNQKSKKHIENVTQFSIKSGIKKCETSLINPQNKPFLNESIDILSEKIEKVYKKSESLIPINLKSEQQKFFANPGTYNPQFIYEDMKTVSSLLNIYQKPNENLLGLAIKIIESFLSLYKTESEHLESQGEILSLEETREKFQNYVDELGLTDYIKLKFEQNTISPTTIKHDPKTGISTITIGLPVEYRKGKIQGVLNHEIGTHFIRKYNDRLQVWAHSRNAYQLKNYIITEEGLASLNQLFEISLQENSHPFLFKSAIHYYTCCLAVTKNFCELYEALGKYIDDPKRRFKTCMRVKRGIEDTRELGGFYKDKVYFEGAVRLLMKRKEIDWKLIFAGKLSIEDLDRPEIRSKINLENVIYPYFIRDEEKYIKVLDKIAKANFIE